MKFQVEQLAFAPADPRLAKLFLSAVGLSDWSTVDRVTASGRVRGVEARNVADLSFNYESNTDKPLELEILNYVQGDNWIHPLRQPRESVVSHIGMHVTDDELLEWRKLMASFDVRVAQEVVTESHTNPAIAGKRRYTYVIFDTRHLIGVDMKFIVRHILEDDPK